MCLSCELFIRVALNKHCTDAPASAFTLDKYSNRFAADTAASTEKQLRASIVSGLRCDEGRSFSLVYTHDAPHFLEEILVSGDET